MPSAETSGVVSVVCAAAGAAQQGEDDTARTMGRMAASVPRITESAPRCSAGPRPRGRPAGSCARSRSGRAAPLRARTRARWQSSAAPTNTCADSAGNPEVTSQTCRSWTSLTPGTPTIAAPDRGHVDAPRRGLEEDPARVAQQEPRGAQHHGRDEQRREPSARSNPVSRITRPAIAVAMNATRSVSTCWNAPSTFNDRRSAPCRTADRDDVDHHADQRDDQHDPALDRGRIDQPPDALVDDQQPEHQQRRAVELRRQDLAALEPVGHRARAPGAAPAGSPPAPAPARPRR